MRDAQPGPPRATCYQDNHDARQPSVRRLCGDGHGREVRANEEGFRRAGPDRSSGTNEFAQPFLDGNFGAEAERGGGVLGRTERMEDVAGARGAVDDGGSRRIVVGKHAGDLEQRRRAAGANVGDTRGYGRCGGGENVGAGDIVDRDEVAGLLPISVNRDAFAVAVVAIENRNDAGVRRGGVLAGTENIEVTLTANREAEGGAVAEQEGLGGEFGRAVRADGLFFGRFANREIGGVAVNRGGGGEGIAE